MYVCVYICSLWYDDIKKFAGGKLSHKTVSIYDHSTVLKNQLRNVNHRKATIRSVYIEVIHANKITVSLIIDLP